MRETTFKSENAAQNALFSHNILEILYSPLPDPTHYFSAPYFKILDLPLHDATV